MIDLLRFSIFLSFLLIVFSLLYLEVFRPSALWTYFSGELIYKKEFIPSITLFVNPFSRYLAEAEQPWLFKLFFYSASSLFSKEALLLFSRLLFAFSSSLLVLSILSVEFKVKAISIFLKILLVFLFFVVLVFCKTFFEASIEMNKFPNMIAYFFFSFFLCFQVLKRPLSFFEYSSCFLVALLFNQYSLILVLLNPYLFSRLFPAAGNKI